MKVYVHSNLKTSGPYDLKDIAEQLQGGIFSFEDLFCYDQKNWVRFYQIPGFKFTYDNKLDSHGTYSEEAVLDNTLEVSAVEKPTKEIMKLDGQLISRVKKYFGGQNFVKIGRNFFVSEKSKTAFVCKVSKFYNSGQRYWFTLSKKEFDLLNDSNNFEKVYAIFFCADHQKNFLFSSSLIIELLKRINNKDNRFHIFIYPLEGKFFIGQPSKANTEDISSYAHEFESESVSLEVSKNLNSKLNDENKSPTDSERIQIDNITSRPNEDSGISKDGARFIEETSSSLKNNKVVKLKFGALINSKKD